MADLKISELTEVTSLTNDDLFTVVSTGVNFKIKKSNVQSSLVPASGNLSESTSSVLSITGGTGAVLGSGTTIEVKQATTTQSGYTQLTNDYTGTSQTLAATQKCVHDAVAAIPSAAAQTDEFTPTAGQTIFTTSQTRLMTGVCDPYINGQRIDQSEYTFTGTTFTYTGPLTLKTTDRLIISYNYSPIVGDYINSVYARTGDILAAAGDYKASQVTNDSIVVGTHVSDALNTLNSGKEPTIAAGTTSQYLRGDKSFQTLNLDALDDVSISSPVLNNYLGYNGSNWTNLDITSVSAGNGVEYFLDSTASDIGSYFSLLTLPSSGSETTVSIGVTSGGGQQLIKSFATPSGFPNTTLLDGGIWTPNLYAYVDDASGVSTITVKVYKRDSGGTETLLFESTTPEINSLSAPAVPYDIDTAQGDFVVLATDRLVFKLYAQTTNATTVNVSVAFQGTTHASHVHTPLRVSHNSLYGLQGGSSNQYYHLNSTQYTETTTLASGSNVNLPSTTSSTGRIKWNGTTYFHTYGPHNIFIGVGSGNITYVGPGYNCCLGETTGNALSSGYSNTLIGAEAGKLISSGIRNTALGNGALFSAATGNNNTALGYCAGYNYTGAEDSNVMIANRGVLGESNVIRIGRHGSGSEEQNKCYLAGTYGITPASSTYSAMIVADDYQLGAKAIGNLSTSTTGLTISGGTGSVFGSGATVNADTGYGIPTTTQISAISHTNRTALDAVSGTNTGDETLATNSGLSLSSHVLAMGTPTTCTGATTNSVTTSTHAHAITGFEPSISTLPISKGGTNSGTALTNGKLIASSAGAIVESSINTPNQNLSTTSSVEFSTVKVSGVDATSYNKFVLYNSSGGTNNKYFALNSNNNGTLTWSLFDDSLAYYTNASVLSRSGTSATSWEFYGDFYAYGDSQLGTLGTSTVWTLTDAVGATQWNIDTTLNNSSYINATNHGYLGIGLINPDTTLEIGQTDYITAAVTDGYTSATTLSPKLIVDDGGSYTITRHNYFNVKNPSITNTSGTITLTDAALFRFDANAGTHKAVDSGTTKTTPSGVDAWIKVNINGSIHYIPVYVSKTA